MTLALRRAAALALLIVPMSVHTGAAQRAGFVVRLGRDTIALEQFTRSAGKLEGELLRRTPVTHLIRYTVTLGGTGLPAELSFTIRRPGAPAPANAIRGGRVVFGQDSARVELQRDTLQARRVAARTGMPALPESYALYEIWLSRLLGSGQDSLPMTLVAPLGGPGGAVQIHRLGADSVLLPIFGTAVRLRTDRDGKLLGLDGQATTIKYDVERVGAMDLASLAQGFAAADAAGRALGTWVSPRDTVTATVGTARLWVDYGRPAARGRAVFGIGVLGDTLWRTGANAATQFRTDADLLIGGRRVPAGTYTLWTHYDGGRAELVINTQTGQWGTQYDRSRDLVRIPLQVRTVEGEPVELFTIAVRPAAGGAGATLELVWDRTVLAVEVGLP